MATAKTLAYGLDCPIVGIATPDALRRAAGPSKPGADFVVVLPAGARDHYVAAAGRDPVLRPPGGDLAADTGGAGAIAVDMPGDVLGAEATARGALALAGLAAALLVLLDERLTRGEADDVAGLVPAYVALPRGIADAAKGMAWSPDLR